MHPNALIAGAYELVNCFRRQGAIGGLRNHHGSVPRTFTGLCGALWQSDK